MTSQISIPTVTIGNTVVPKLFLGDHGYLAKLDSAMTSAEVATSIARMASLAAVGVAAGERRVVDAAIAARECGNPEPPLMIHADVPVSLAGNRVRYRRCAATMAAAFARHGVDLRSDPILGFLYEVGADAAPLAPDGEALELTVDHGALRSLLTDVERARPRVITVGGDWLDMLLVLGRNDLAAEGLRIIGQHAQQVGAALVWTTYIGAMPIDRCRIEDHVDGIMVAASESGAAMLPNPAAHRKWIEQSTRRRSHEQPRNHRAPLRVIGMHLLAGQTEPLQALNWLRSSSVDIAVIGASSDQHQDALATASATAFSEESG